MSPSADDIAKKLGRPLETGDILIGEGQTSILGMGFDVRVDGHYEIIGFNKETKSTFLGIRGRETNQVIVRELTSHGPTLERLEFPTREDLWGSAIRKEERTDRPSLKER